MANVVRAPSPAVAAEISWEAGPFAPLIIAGAAFIGAFVGDWVTGPDVLLNDSAGGKLQDLTGKTREEARQILEDDGFVHKGDTERGCGKWYHPDGSRVQIRPNVRLRV